MKPKSTPAFTTCFWLLALLLAPALVAADSTAVGAAAQPTGTISGRVQNGATGRYLNNARVSVPGTNLVALTDQTGAYRLINVVPGPENGVGLWGLGSRWNAEREDQAADFSAAKKLPSVIRC